MHFSRVLLALTFVALTSCGGYSPITWPTVAQCGAGGISNAAPQVQEILLQNGNPQSFTLTSAGKQDLVDLGLKFGVDTIACLVNRVVNDWSRPGLAQDPLVVAGAARGRAFLQEVGVKSFEGASGGESP